MSLRDPQTTMAETQRKAETRRAVILTSYMTGATRGKNLGVPGYSYDLVAQLFVPLLARWGEVIQVAREAEPLESAVHEARRRGLDPVHVSFLPFQDVSSDTIGTECRCASLGISRRARSCLRRQPCATIGSPLPTNAIS